MEIPKSDMKKELRIKGYLLIVISIAAVLLSGCRESDDVFGLTETGFLDFVFSREAPQTRAEIGEDGSGAFVDGDRIGLYIEQNTGTYRHIVLTRQNGTWTPRLRKSDLGEGLVTLNAYYPARDDIQDEVTDDRHKHSVSTDQQAEGYETSDLLWSNRTINTATLIGNRIEFPFNHGMHRLVVEVENEEGELPEELTVSVRGRTQGTAYLFTGQVTPAEDSETEWIAARKLGEGRYCAVFYPQKLKQGEEWVKITTSAKESVYKSPATVGGNSSLEQGKQTVLRLTLRSNGTAGQPDEPDPEYANKTCWVYGAKTPETPDYPRDNEESVPDGGHIPDNFPSGVWFRTTNLEFLNWQSTYRWYDCDKDNPEVGASRPGYKDWNMCWAASASNLLHWWMYHNRQYIELYDQRYNANPWPAYPRPSDEFSDRQKSGIFNFFRETCRNVGGSSHYGVNWFVCGNSVGIPAQNMDVYNNFGGYFTELFKNKDVAKNYKALKKSNFNSLVKDAFEHNRALGFDIASYGPHAMVIWGAEFDETGYVSAIYYVDNNDYYNFEVTGGSNNYQHHLLIRRKVTYHETGVYLGNSQTTINGLNVVDLGRDVWEKEFGRLPENAY